MTLNNVAFSENQSRREVEGVKESLDLKEFVISRCTDLHVKINYGTSYGNNDRGAYEKLKDIIRFDQLKEVVDANPEWSNEEIGKEVSKRVRERTSIY